MRTISARAWVLVLVSALLQVFCFPTGGAMWPWRGALSWIALIPLLLALLEPNATGRPLAVWQGAALGYVGGIVFYLGNCWWIYQTMYLYGGLPHIVSFGILLLFALYLGLYHALFGLGVAYLRRGFSASARAFEASSASATKATPVAHARSSSSHGSSRRRRRNKDRMDIGIRNALIFTPFLWTALELLRGRITGFPWDLLGYAQVDNHVLTGLAPLAGVMAMSFALVAVNAALVSVVYRKGTARYVLPVGALLAAVLVQTSGMGEVSASLATPQDTAILLQENLKVGATARGQRPLSREEELAIFSDDSEHPAHRVIEGVTRRWSTDPAELHPTVIVWPEAPSHLQSNDPLLRAKLGELARTESAPVIAGSLGVDPDASTARGYKLYDSASLIDKDGVFKGRYDKVHLVPWGEYVPFKALFGFAKKLTEGVGDMDPGTTRGVFTTGGHSYGVFVCYESVFGDEVRQFAQSGAQVLVNISDDGWYGETGAPWQHLNMARMRAIENNRWVLRATNTGVTTAIAPSGVVAYEAPRHVRGAFAFGFDFIGETTLYTKYGDWFAWVCLFLTAAMAGLAVPGQSREPALIEPTEVAATVRRRRRRSSSR
jgi:apolipoprotein N-acyltransferase